MNRLKRSMLICVLAIVLTTLLSAGVVQAAGLSGPTWRIVKSPNVSSFNELRAVAVVSATDIWIVGYYMNSSNAFLTLVEHWNGTSWQVVSSPNVGSGGVLYGVAVVSANNIWAVGDYFNSSGTAFLTLIEHWNGSSWQVVPSPSPGSNANELSSVVALSASNVWAVGGYNNSGGPEQTLVEHWNGTSWQVVSSPNVGSGSNELSSVAAVSAKNIWAVGDSNYTSQTLIEHWNGSSWKVVASPNVGSSNNQLYGVATVSASNIWAVGVQAGQTLIEHWNGSSWQVVSGPNPGSGSSLLGVAAVSANDLWAVGVYIGSSGLHQTLIEHWNGSNWRVVSSPNVRSNDNELRGVAAVSANDLWAVGDSLNINVDQTLTEHYS